MVPDKMRNTTMSTYSDYIASNAIGNAASKGQITQETLLAELRSASAQWGWTITPTIPADVLASAAARRYDALSAWVAAESSPMLDAPTRRAA